MNASKVSTNTGRIFQLKEQIQNDLPTYEADISGLDIKQQLPLDYITLTQGTGLDVEMSGNDFALNDYNNMLIRRSTADQNIADGSTAILINAFQPFISKINTDLYINQGKSEVLITGDYLLDFSITVYKNSYVGPITFRVAGRDRLNGKGIVAYLHLATDETIGTIHLPEIFVNVTNGVVAHYFFTVNKFDGAPAFQSNCGGIGFQANYQQTWEYVGEWGLWQQVAINTANLVPLETATPNIEMDISGLNIKQQLPLDYITLTQGTGLDVEMSGNDFALNDYNNMSIKVRPANANYNSGNIVLLDYTGAIRNNIELFQLDQRLFPTYTGDYLVSSSVSVVRNSYVGAVTFWLRGRDQLSNKTANAYIHLAENENTGIILLSENFVDINANAQVRFEIRVKKSPDIGFTSTLTGLGLRIYSFNTFEFVGGWGDWVDNTTSILTIQNTTIPNIETSIIELNAGKGGLPIMLTNGNGLELNGVSLNDYNNMSIKVRPANINFNSGNIKIYILDYTGAIRNNIELFQLDRRLFPTYTGDYLVSSSVSVVRNSYVGAVTFWLRGRDQLSNKTANAYIHLAENENTGIILLSENFVDINANAQVRFEIRVKKSPDIDFTSTLTGFGLRIYSFNTFEYIGEWDD